MEKNLMEGQLELTWQEAVVRVAVVVVDHVVAALVVIEILMVAVMDIAEMVRTVNLVGTGGMVITVDETDTVVVMEMVDVRAATAAVITATLDEMEDMVVEGMAAMLLVKELDLVVVEMEDTLVVDGIADTPHVIADTVAGMELLVDSMVVVVVVVVLVMLDSNKFVI